MFLPGSDHDDGGGVVPLAVLQDGGVCPHVLDHNTTLAVMPVNLDKSQYQLMSISTGIFTALCFTEPAGIDNE